MLFLQRSYWSALSSSFLGYTCGYRIKDETMLQGESANRLDIYSLYIRWRYQCLPREEEIKTKFYDIYYSNISHHPPPTHSETFRHVKKRR